MKIKLESYSLLHEDDYFEENPIEIHPNTTTIYNSDFFIHYNEEIEIDDNSDEDEMNDTIFKILRNHHDESYNLFTYEYKMI